MNSQLRLSSRPRGCRSKRDGGVALITAIVLLVLLGFTALAIDLGYLMLGTTQMQAASDSASLAGGTELLPGLGRFATKSAAQVEGAARPVAQTYAAFNRNADQIATYIDQNRDVEFGQAVFDGTSWIQTIGAQPYNMVRASVLRNQAGSGSGDAPVPLFFARVLGHDESSMERASAAVIMPADGFKVSEPGEASGVMPFAFKEKAWKRLRAAQDWYKTTGGGNPANIPNTYTPGNPSYPMYDPGNGAPLEPMFHRHAYDSQGNLRYDRNGNPIWERDIYDNFSANPADSTETATVTGQAPPQASTNFDGWLEVNLYPESTGGAITAGNAGTVDLGDTANAAQAIADQILGGLTYEDYQAMEAQGLLTDGQFILDPDNNIEVTAEGDTGISGGPIQQAFDQIIGETRAILLYSQVSSPGNNAEYTLVEFVGVRVLFARMNSGTKSIWIQMAPHQDGTAVPDWDEVPGPDTTVFTPLILIE
jgi:Flp pilus assembly protein TadG